MGQIESRHIKANPKVHEEYERLRSSASVSTPFMQHDCPCRSVLTLSLLNVRSLRKHSKDIRFNLQLFKSDILALTETQLLPNDSDNEITDNLKPFKIYRQDYITDKYSSMAVCTRDTVQMVDCEYYPSLNALKFVLMNIET